MSGPTFTLFGGPHLAVLLVAVATCLLVTRIPRDRNRRGLATAIALLLLLIALLKPLTFVFVYDQPWQRNLPLDLCRLNELLCAYLLLARSYRVFEVAYFLAMAGSSSALLMPDLRDGFPDPRFLLFFSSHILALLAVLYAIFGYGFRPTLRSLGITLTFLGGYTLTMAGVNLWLDANYLFLREKPEGASILDVMGPWPWYLVALMAVAVVACGLCYLPFARRPVTR